MPKISEEKKKIRRELILSAALEVFCEKGFTLATLEDIMKCSGLSKGGIYTYFKSKEEIFLEIAESRFKKRSEYLKSFDSGVSADQKIERYMHWVLDGLQSSDMKKSARFTFEFWSFMSRNEQTKKVAAIRYAKFEADLLELIEEGMDQGVFRMDLEKKSLVYILLTSMDGMAFADSVMGISMNDKIIKEQINMILMWIKN